MPLRDFNEVRAEITNSVPTVHVYNSATQSITASSDTALTFDSERYDRWGMHSTSSNTSRLTCVVPGIYRIGGCGGFAADTVGTRRLGIQVGGTTFISLSTIPAAPAGVTILNVVTEYPLTVGQYVELRIFHTSTTDPLSTHQQGDVTPEFWMTWVGN